MFVLSLRWLRLNIEANLMFVMQRSLMHFIVCENDFYPFKCMTSWFACAQ